MAVTLTLPPAGAHAPTKYIVSGWPDVPASLDGVVWPKGIGNGCFPLFSTEIIMANTGKPLAAPSTPDRRKARQGEVATTGGLYGRRGRVRGPGCSLAVTGACAAATAASRAHGTLLTGDRGWLRRCATARGIATDSAAALALTSTAAASAWKRAPGNCAVDAAAARATSLRIARGRA